jgi:hypothetical protein
VTALVPDQGLRLNPDAPHPPFRWQIALPDTWAVLDTHPSTWQRNLDRLVDDRFAGQRLKAAERREVLAALEELVVSAQRGGVLLSLVHLGRLASGGVASAGLHLAWYDSSPELATLATVRKAASRQGTIDEVETEAGTLVLQRDHIMMAPTGLTTRQGLTSLQAFLPLAGRPWTAVVATASAHPELTDALRELVVTVAGSIAVVDPAVADTPPPSGEAYVPADPVSGPGIEHGFGTMVVRRIEPESP